jgi:hypothetical protein
MEIFAIVGLLLVAGEIWHQLTSRFMSRPRAARPLALTPPPSPSAPVVGAPSPAPGPDVTVIDRRAAYRQRLTDGGHTRHIAHWQRICDGLRIKYLLRRRTARRTATHLTAPRRTTESA